jgi:hypothetical protein
MNTGGGDLIDNAWSDDSWFCAHRILLVLMGEVAGELKLQFLFQECPPRGEIFTA